MNKIIEQKPADLCGLSNRQIIIWISSVTGNTEEVASALIEQLLALNYEPLLKCSSAAMTRRLADKYQLREAADDLSQEEEGLPVILCFWCRRGSMDDKSIDFLTSLSKRKLLIFGTMGSYPESEYGQLVYQSVEKLARNKNSLKGIHLCRGRIDPRRTEKRRNLPADHKHYLDDQGYARHLSSRSHPDREDIQGACDILADHIADLTK